MTRSAVLLGQKWNIPGAVHDYEMNRALAQKLRPQKFGDMAMFSGDGVIGLQMRRLIARNVANQ